MFLLPPVTNIDISNAHRNLDRTAPDRSADRAKLAKFCRKNYFCTQVEPVGKPVLQGQ